MKKRIIKRRLLGNHRFNWRQRDFALSSFGCDTANMRVGLTNLKEAGFNTLELGWSPHEKSWEAVELCEELGIDLIFQDLTIMGGMQHRFLKRDVPVTIDTVKDLVKKLEGKRRTVGYYVWDEPWFDDQFDEARRQSDMLEEIAPDALLFSVALPSYNPDFQWENGLYPAYFEKFVNRMDPPVLSVDYYPIGSYPMETEQFKYSPADQLDRDYFWCDLALLRRWGLKKDIPYWFYYQGCDLYHAGYLTFPMIRMMMYAAVMYGAKGLQHYRANEDAVVYRDSGERAVFFEDQKAIHKEFAALGNTLMALRSELVYHSEDLLCDKDFALELMDKQSDSPVFASKLPKRTSVGELVDPEGNRYILVLNRDYEKPLNTTLQLKGDMRFYEVSKKDGTQSIIADRTSTLKIDLAPGDATLLRVESADTLPCEIEYVIEG